MKKGEKMSQIQKNKISHSHFGKKVSLKIRNKLKKSHKGVKLSLYHRKRISDGLKGNKYSLGYKHSKKTRQKMSNSHKGKKSYLWKGGITKEVRRIRTSFELKDWKNFCLERDNYICQKYKIRGGNLEVHHINNFADYPDLRFVVDNGITLSKRAHKEFHKKYGYRNNTKEQLFKFLRLSTAVTSHILTSIV